MERTCLKCGFFHTAATGAELEECPKCGAIYSRVEQSRIRPAPPALPSKESVPLMGSPGNAAIIKWVAISLSAVMVLGWLFSGLNDPSSRVQKGKANAHLENASSTTKNQGTPFAKATQTTSTTSQIPPQPVANQAEEEQKRLTCKSISIAARTIMERRHEGVSMSSMMEVQMDPAVRRIMEALIVAAYDAPRYHSPAMQLRASQNFENDAYLTCVKSLTP